MSDSTFGFIGLGLIGGSIAKGLRRSNKDITIMAYMGSYRSDIVLFMSTAWLSLDHCRWFGI